MSHFQGSIDEMKAEAETMIAAAKVEGEQIKRKGAEQVQQFYLYLKSGKSKPYLECPWSGGRAVGETDDRLRGSR